jgi:hypothetical protein
MEENVATREVTENRRTGFVFFPRRVFLRFLFMRRIGALKGIERREIVKVDKYKGTFPDMK